MDLLFKCQKPVKWRFNAKEEVRRLINWKLASSEAGVTVWSTSWLQLVSAFTSRYKHMHPCGGKSCFHLFSQCNKILLRLHGPYQQHLHYNVKVQQAWSQMDGWNTHTHTQGHANKETSSFNSKIKKPKITLQLHRLTVGSHKARSLSAIRRHDVVQL